MSTRTPERWPEISPHLDHALSLPEAERDVWPDESALGPNHPDTLAALRLTREAQR